MLRHTCLLLLVCATRSWVPHHVSRATTTRLVRFQQSRRLESSTFLRWILPNPNHSLQVQQTARTQEQDFFIRKSVTADLEIAATILSDGFFKSKKTNFLTYHWDRLGTLMSLDSCFPKEYEAHELFVACSSQSGQVVGLVEVDARNTPNGRGQDGPYMCNLAVDFQHQRKGIASVLVHHVEQQVQAWNSYSEVANSLHLKVRRSNQAAVIMYDKLGYRSYRQEKDDKGEVVLVMRKSLDNDLKELETKELKSSSNLRSSS
jgi:ribosomal protein S18 acetylase RimI-like enzyme